MSFFRDLVASKKGDDDAAQRLQRHNTEMATKGRALDNTGGTGGSGGEFAPPAWLEPEFVALTRAARVTADRLNKQPLPSGVSTVNIPKVTTGTITAVHSTQTQTVASTDPTTSALSSGITTIAGKVVTSLQLLQQSPIAFAPVRPADGRTSRTTPRTQDQRPQRPHRCRLRLSAWARTCRAAPVRRRP